MMEPLRTYESWGWQYVVFSNQIFPPFLVLRLGREIIKEFLFFVINGTHPPTARTGVSAHDIAQFLLPDTISRRMLEALDGNSSAQTLAARGWRDALVPNAPYSGNSGGLNFAFSCVFGV